MNPGEFMMKEGYNQVIPFFHVNDFTTPLQKRKFVQMKKLKQFFNYQNQKT